MQVKATKVLARATLSPLSRKIVKGARIGTAIGAKVADVLGTAGVPLATPISKGLGLASRGLKVAERAQEEFSQFYKP